LMANEPVARAYAEALLHIARVEGVVDAVEEELRSLQNVLRTHYELKGFLDNQAVTKEGKLDAIGRLFAGKMSAITVNFLNTVVERARHRLLEDIADQYIALVSAFREQVTAEVVTAVPLPEETAERLRKALSRMVNKDVLIRQSVDESILGGAIVKIGDRIIDGCVRKKLQNLRTAMVEKL